MKIYNKKGFFTGLFWLLIAGCQCYLAVYKGMDFTNAFFCFVSLALAVLYLSRSLSKNTSEADQDELTVHLLNRSRSLAFFWSKVLYAAFMVYWLLLYSHIKDEIYMVLFMNTFIMLAGMIIIQIITEIYCERKIE